MTESNQVTCTYMTNLPTSYFIFICHNKLTELMYVAFFHKIVIQRGTLLPTSFSLRPVISILTILSFCQQYSINLRVKNVFDCLASYIHAVIFTIIHREKKKKKKIRQYHTLTQIQSDQISSRH